MKTKLRYDIIGCGPIDHPQKVMEKIAKIHNFKVIKSEPISVADCWIFTIEYEKKLSYLPLPCYVEEVKTDSDDAGL